MSAVNFTSNDAIEEYALEVMGSVVAHYDAVRYILERIRHDVISGKFDEKSRRNMIIGFFELIKEDKTFIELGYDLKPIYDFFEVKND